MNAADAARASREELIAENNRLEDALAEQRYRLTWLERQLFGQKSERFVPADDQQTTLALGVESALAAAESTQRITYERKAVSKQAGHSRGAMPSHLPVKDVRLEPEGDAVRGQFIGEEITWEYQYARGSLYVRRYIRPKYSTPDGTGVTIASLPARPIDKGNAGAGLLAHIITQKYLYHMPLDRQRRQFWAEYQVDFAESTLTDWVRESCFWFEPVYVELVRQVRASSYIQADETPIPVLVGDKRGKTHRGYFWVYHAPEQKLTVFSYAKSRSRDGPNDFLKTFTGTLQVDGYTGYNDVLGRADVVWAACMAHVRRKFDEALLSNRQQAAYALEVLKDWFAVEAESREAGLDPEQRRAVRAAQIAPSMEEFHGWLKQQALSVLPKSPLGNAVAYALNQWKGFDAFLTDGRIELSNNRVENHIRPVALGRKNYLFAGSHDAAQRSAIIYSLSATAQMTGIDPHIYFTHLLERLPAANHSDVPDFVPARWKPRYLDDAIKRQEQG